MIDKTNHNSLMK